MDYEKKYNHALEVVRELQKDWASTQNRAAREIELAFPELRESEDERIMKILSEVFADSGDRFISEYERKLVVPWLEKQKEQKPAWSEEDEKMRYFVTEAVQSRYSDRELAKYLDPKIINEKMKLKQKIFDWLRDLRPSWKPSEELLDALYIVANLPELEFYGGIKYKIRELYKQLKKL